MKIYNTLTREKQELKARNNKVRIFVCGPTVYDNSHIGHARTYIAFDMFVKYLREKLNYEVFYLQNITDIDDKIINRSWEEKRSAKEVANEYTKKYFEDMDALGVDSVDKYAPASEYIDEIIKQVQLLIDNDYAYKTESGVYFRVKNFKNYGKLSGQKPEEMQDAVNIEEDTSKEDPHDFVLWKAAKENEPQWESPWGPGRPGWHIEDTAIAQSEMGSAQYELHGGARDLIFPHHEAEIAQMEAAYEVEPMVEYWIHTGFLQVGGEKMSKSVKNFITIRDALKVASPQTLRIFFTTKHYRSPIDYTEGGVKEAEVNEKRLTEFWLSVKNLDTEDGKNDVKIRSYQDNFWGFLEDDFNTPRAFAELFQLISHVNKKDSISNDDKQGIEEFLKEINAIFSVVNEDNLEIEIPSDVLELVEKREQARKSKDWEKADELRKAIEEKGYSVRDAGDGPEVRKL